MYMYYDIGNAMRNVFGLIYWKIYHYMYNVITI